MNYSGRKAPLRVVPKTYLMELLIRRYVYVSSCKGCLVIRIIGRERRSDQSFKTS